MKNPFPNYIPLDKYENIRNYKYKGGDTSIFYIYCMCPFCDWLVPKFPIWLAPNVITITGFLLNLSYFTLTTIYSGLKGTTILPPWVCYYSAISYCVYITLDNCDGKQSRRNNSSSPLGLLVDHGTDACTTFFITLGIGSIAGLNNIYDYTLVWIMIIVPFFLNTWEEYYTGELILPIIHGVSEGMLIIALVECISGFYGVSFWLRSFYLFNSEIKYNSIIVFGGFLAGIFFGIVSIVKVCMRIEKSKIPKAIFDTLWFFFYLGSYLLIIFKSNSIIVKEYPKILILGYGFEFAKIMGILQLSHIMNDNFNPYRIYFIIPVLLNSIHTLIYLFLGFEILCSIDYIIVFTLIWNFLSWAHFVYFCSEEMCEILNIKRFSIGKRYPELKEKKTQ